MYKNKRGVSQIITTIIIVLISLVAALAVWQIVERYTQGGTGCDVDCFTISLNVGKVDCVIETVGTETHYMIKVPVTRGGDGIEGGDLIVTATNADGNSEESTPIALGSLGTATATIDIGTVGVTSTIVTPGLKICDGETTCSVTSNVHPVTCV